MADKARPERDSIDAITKIRVRNNDLWMEILEVALRSSPEETRDIIRRIAYNDALVVKEFKKITGD